MSTKIREDCTKNNLNSDKGLITLNKILLDINHSDSPEEILNYLIDRCIEITKATSGSVMLVNSKANVLDVKVIRGLRKNVISDVKLRIGEGVTGRVASTGTPLLISDVGAINYYIRLREDLKSELAVPLIVNSEVIGVLNVDSNKLNAFTEEDLDILQTISNIVVQILNKEQVINELSKKVEIQSLLLRISDLLERQSGFDGIFNKIMEMLSQCIPLKRGMLVILKPDNKLKISQGYRLSDEAINRGIYEVGEGIIGNVVKNGQAIVLKNISEASEFLNKMKIKRSRESFYAIPIKYSGKTGGVLAVEKDYIDDNDLNNTRETLIIIASLIANKVENNERVEKERNELIARNKDLSDRLGVDKGAVLIGKNDVFKNILETTHMVADTDATILITGATGTGKEVLARKLHFTSSRAFLPFIGINCAAIPGQLLESELFGYKRGAFTGAATDKKGKFVLANKGTIFLDEIGDLDFNLQAKLLRVLQEKQVEPLGSEQSLKIDVRVIVATNKDLAQLVKEGKFREDLFYRINVIPIHLPNLSERKEDIPLLVNHFVEKFSDKYKKHVNSVSDTYMKFLLNYSWPGNIRELENTIERSVILSYQDRLDENTLSVAIREERTQALSLETFVLNEIKAAQTGTVYDSITGKVEKIIIDHALINFNNNQSEAARWLGIHRNTLREKINSPNIISPINK
jgi:Nif-specific regulatory protein